MKTSNRSKFHKGGYAALLSTVSLSLTVIAFAITSFRETRQSHIVQARNQVKLDYSQKERALLRSLLDIVPNTAMQAMAENSNNNQNDLNWPAIFQQALTTAQVNQSLDSDSAANLGISVNVVSANTGDANPLPSNFIVSPNGSGHMAMEDSHTTRPASLSLPPLMRFVDGGHTNSDTSPIINFNKRLGNSSPLYTEMRYPEIAFGYAAQGSDFIAKRNWWAFTVNFGAESAAITGIAPSPRTYVLSIYEVPTQLAISSSGATTSLGQFDGGSSWNPANISIAGSIYTNNALIHDLTAVGSVASRGGVELSSTAPSGQSIGGLAERRELRATTTTNSFYPYSSSSDSGLVSFTPINRGSDFFDYFADTTSAERSSSHFSNTNTRTGHTDYLSENFNHNSVNDLDWSHYSVGARQVKMRVDIEQVSSASFQLPTGIFTTARFNGDSESRRQRARTSAWWRAPGQSSISLTSSTRWDNVPAGDDWFVQPALLPDGRPSISLDIEKIPQFLSIIAADDVTINNSIWIGPNYGFNNVTQAGNTPNDTVLLIEKSTDLSAFTNGLTIITPYTVYFADNFNNVPVVTPPPGIPSPWYPPVSVYAPDKRFGIQNTSGKIQLDGQIGYLPDTSNTNTVNPLDLKDGGTDTVTPSNISATLRGVTRAEDLPPINAMSWLTVIEEVR